MQIYSFSLRIFTLLDFQYYLLINISLRIYSKIFTSFRHSYKKCPKFISTNLNNTKAVYSTEHRAVKKLAK